MAEEKSPIEKAAEALEGKMAAFKTETIAAAKAEVLAATAEIATLKTEIEAVKLDATAKGATIIQLKDLQDDMKKKAGRIYRSGADSAKTLIDLLGETINKNAALFDAAGEKNDGSKLQFELKVSDITSGSLVTTGASPYANFLDWRPGMEPTGQIRFRDLVRTIPSAFDTVYYPRANSPVGLGSFGKQTTEGTAKAQIDRGYTMIALTLLPFAGWLNVSRQALRNIPFLQAWLPTSMNEQLMDAEDVDFSVTLSGSATGSATLPGSGPGSNNAVEKLIFLIKNLIQAKFAPTGVAVEPTVWAEILVTKPNDYSLPNAVTVTPSGQVLILGKPIYPVNWLQGRRVIVGDWTKAAIVESEGLTFRQTDSNASLFVANELTFLLERVEGLAIFRRDAFISTTV